jgi:hypothetical protein
MRHLVKKHVIPTPTNFTLRTANVLGFDSLRVQMKVSKELVIGEVKEA